MFKQALTYPTNSDDWPVKIGILAVLSLFSWLLFPIFLVLGYYSRVLRTTVEGESQLPEWGDWGNLFVDGLKLFVVAFVYLLIPTIVAVIVAFTLGDFSPALSALIVFVVFAVFYYLLPASITNHAVTGDIGDGFDVDRLMTLLRSPDYAVAWLIAMGILLVGGIVIGLLALIPVLGWIAGLIVGGIVYLAGLRVYGLAYRDIIGDRTL